MFGVRFDDDHVISTLPGYMASLIKSTSQNFSLCSICKIPFHNLSSTNFLEDSVGIVAVSD